MVPDASQAVYVEDGKTVPVSEVLQDEKWIREDFIPTVQNRGTTVIEKRGLSSAMSAAQATADHLTSWICGTPQGRTASMGVWSDGSYGAPKEVIFSFPVTCRDGDFTIVQGQKVDNFTASLLQATGEELVAERKEAGY